MKMFRFRATAMLLFGLFSAYALSGAPKVPPQERPKTPTSKAAAAAQEQVSPEERQKRKDWNDGMLRKAAPTLDRNQRLPTLAKSLFSVVDAGAHATLPK
jgi:hypothetical protein